MRFLKRYLFVFLLLNCVVCQVFAEESTRLITDMAGRKVTIPAKVSRVYCTNGISPILVYTLAPEKLIGWPLPLSTSAAKYIAPPYDTLPVLGGWFGKGNAIGLEQMIQARPDMILFVSMGSLGKTDQYSISMTDDLQAQTRIPVVIVQGYLADTEQCYRLLGDWLGVPERGAELADYIAKTLKDVQEKVKTISPDKYPRVYYAEGPKGLETDPPGSAHVELLDTLKAVNVAKVGMVQGGRVPVSMEQLLAWNPEIIISEYRRNLKTEGGFYEQISKDLVWKNIAAVKNKKVYETPQYPYNWLSHPPSVNRILGIKWVANLLYPDVFSYDIRRETNEFYDLFYRKKLTEEEVDELLDRALPFQ